ncbi:cysteine proteinase [Collybia nuda]|uniref:Cysteine proteinase n=1 Tax=Collybia nuda TaxID=64659 RepID=A0A9P5Y4K2_9AGAR|nr:cysteine proteinase [Collybia nuda]
MKPSALFSSPATDPVPSPQTTFKQDKAAILVTQELEKAIAECKKKVASIAKSCRAKNRRFRDPEFDLERDKDRCLHGLSGSQYSPSDVRRVNEIFDDPQFYIDGVSSSDLVQGGIGDCWFISALATASCAPGLVEKFCVARDEQVGVYGFIFFRDAAWVTVIIDDLLYSSIPKYEELSFTEKSLYHNNKDIYNKTARRGGKSLLFARSGTENETWVPLIEKAYAKLHGDYYALSGGFSHEAIEDMTGGIAGLIRTQDILDIDQFWNEELLNANQGRLFGCSFENMQTDRLEFPFPQIVKGLFGSHDYSVLRAVEFKGKRFVVVRNPWGESEWTGPWSDGSKEWTKETLEALSVLGHEFGDDGQFVMEYRDFLASWGHVHRTLLFDSSWVMSSHWLRVPVRPFPSNLEYGDVSFTINIPKVTRTVIVLSRLDDRYFRDLAGSSDWSFNFILYKKGDPEEIMESQKLYFGLRSVNIELELDAGDYVVHVGTASMM